MGNKLIITGEGHRCPCLKHYTMKVYMGVKVLLCAFLASPLDGNEWSALQPGPWRKNRQCSLDIRLGGPQNQSDLSFFLFLLLIRNLVTLT